MTRHGLRLGDFRKPYAVIMETNPGEISLVDTFDTQDMAMAFARSFDEKFKTFWVVQVLVGWTG